MESLSFKLEGIIKNKSEYEDFEGPLDLILHLLSKNRVEIKDISIATLVDQYLAWIREREEMDLEIASDFVVMASHLVWLKTRMLLSIDDEETREEMEKLIRSLEERQKMEEYKKMRLGASYLSGRSEIGRSIYIRPPSVIEPNKTYRYSHEKDELSGAYNSLRDRVACRMPPPPSAFRGIVGRELYSVRAKLNMLVQRFLFKPVATLRELWLDCRSRSELVATFLAVLELCRHGQVEVSSGENSDDIVLRAAGSGTIKRAD